MGTNTKEIQENNKLIAGFMEYKLITPEMRKNKKAFIFSYWQKGYPEKEDVLCEEKGLKYHSSWDWLMPVVEKIENTFNVDSAILTKSTVFNNQVIVASSKIEATYLAVIEFIKWHTSPQT